MEQQLQLLRGEVLNIIAVISKLLGIHNATRHFDGTSKVEIVVALVEGKFLELLLIDAWSVPAHIEIDWSCSCNGGFVRNHVEIETSLCIYFVQDLIDDSTWAWVLDLTILYMEKSGVNKFIDHAIDYFRLVILEVLAEHRF